MLGARKTERSSIVLANVWAKRLGPTETQISYSVNLEGQSGRAVPIIQYGRWVRKGDAEEPVCVIGRCSDECALVESDNGTSTIC